MADMSVKKRRKSGVSKDDQVVPAVSAVLAGGVLVELVYRPDEGKTMFAVWQDDDWELCSHVNDASHRLVPYSPNNSLMQSNVVLFPSEPLDYGSQKQLVKEVRAFIHRYVDVNDAFEHLAAYYVLFSWLYDNFNELPYLRLKGDYGTGKTRFLQAVGAICYRPIFANGASTVSPIFHMLDTFGGTLIMDEADFHFSHETAEMVKILNNGNVRGMPVLRAQMTSGHEFNPRVFRVFGPKIIATRGDYDDPALESRFITEVTAAGSLRDDIPLNLPPSYEAEALTLRNKLLMFRFVNWGQYKTTDVSVDRSDDPRLHQILSPLLSIVEDKKVRDVLFVAAKEYRRGRATMGLKTDAA